MLREHPDSTDVEPVVFTDFSTCSVDNASKAFPTAFSDEKNASN